MPKCKRKLGFSVEARAKKRCEMHLPGGYVDFRNFFPPCFTTANRSQIRFTDLGIVSKPKLLNLIFNSKLMVIPIEKGTGTRIKIIEAMLIGAKILPTSEELKNKN